MKIILVNINRECFRSRIAPLGLCSLATYLKHYINKDIEIEILDQNVENIYKRIKKFVKNKPDLIGVSSVTQNFEEAKRFMSLSRKQLDVPIILGGVHVSTMPSSLPQYVDVGVIGEGEETFLELVNILLKNDELISLDDVKGICFYKDDKLIINEKRPLIDPLDKIPIPDRTYLNMDYYLKKASVVPFQTGRNTHIITSRGCPFSCAFCSTAVFWGKPRVLPVERVIDEIEYLVSKYNVNIIHVFDDLFLINKKRFFEVVNKIEEEGINKKVKFMCLVRADSLNDKVMEALRKMNVVCVGIGLESGSDKVLSYLKNKTITVEQNRRTIKYCKDYGITCMGSFMIGNPTETKEDLNQTLNLIKENQYNPYFSALTYISTPLPGTQLWNYAKQMGCVANNMNWENLCMDIPSRKEDFDKIPVLTKCDGFYGIAQEFRKENEVQHLKCGNIVLTEDLFKDILSHPVKSFKSYLKLLRMKKEIKT